MNVARSFDAKAFNRIINHPEVYPWVAMDGVGELDATKLIEDQRNYLLVDEHGGCLFIPTHDGQYEVHTQILPEGRGGSLAIVRAAFHFMFTQTDCVAVTSYIPEGNVGAERMSRAMNFTHTGREGTWTFPGGKTVPLDWIILTKDRWLQCQ